jgi:hypothetical protein
MTTFWRSRGWTPTISRVRLNPLPGGGDSEEWSEADMRTERTDDRLSRGSGEGADVCSK